jgi:hypothetical protein
MLNTLESSAARKIFIRPCETIAGVHPHFTAKYLSHFDSLAKHFVYNSRRKLLVIQWQKVEEFRPKVQITRLACTRGRTRTGPGIWGEHAVI